MADTGVKAMIPIDRPFLDYVLSELCQSGYTDVCLIIGPEHHAVRTYYTQTAPPEHLGIHFGIQAEPRGTADAVAAAEDFAGSDPFIVINSDNHYPQSSLAALSDLDQSGLVGFDRQAMIENSNIPADRVTKFGVIQTGDDGYMSRIIEKPSPEVLASLDGPLGLSMNCWRFGPEIFEACAKIELSPRGELEITDAVSYSMEHLGVRYRVIRSTEPVLDLSSRSDIASVTARLKGTAVSY